MTSERVGQNALDLSSPKDNNSPTNWSETAHPPRNWSPISPKPYSNIRTNSLVMRSSLSPQMSPASFTYSEDRHSPPARTRNPIQTRDPSAAAGVVRQLAYADRVDYSQLLEKDRLMNLAKECLVDALATEKKTGSDTARILVKAALENFHQRATEFEKYKALLMMISPNMPDLSFLNTPLSSDMKPNSNADMPDLVLASPPRIRSDPPLESPAYSSDSSPSNSYVQRPNQVCGKRKFESIEQWARAQTLGYSSDINASTGGKVYESGVYSEGRNHDRGGDSMDFDRGGPRVGGGGVGMRQPEMTGGSREGDLVSAELQQVMNMRCARMTASGSDSYTSNGTSRDGTMTDRMSMLTTEKDEAYYERRRKNNEAAKRSRDSRRTKEEKIGQRVVFLEAQNLQLKAQIAMCKAENDQLQHLLCERYIRRAAPPPPPGNVPTPYDQGR